MKYYLITETLKEVPREETKPGEFQYVAVLDPKEWAELRESF